MRQVLLAVMVVVGLVLAGCAGSGQTESIGPEEDEGFGQGTASIVGLVMTNELTPIAGAQVQIDELDLLVTDEAGWFEAHGLAAGSHRVVVGALGYVSAAQQVSVGEDESREVRFTLDSVPVAEPFVEVSHDRGYSACDYMLVVLTGRVPPPCDTGQEPNNEFVKPVDESWRFHVTEAVWESTSAFEETMRLFAADDGGCQSENPCYGLVYGEEYARLEGEPGKTELVEHYDPWMDHRGPPYPENESFEMHVNVQWIGLLVDNLNSVPTDPCQTIFVTVTGAGYKPGCVGVGVSVGVAFDVWTSVFHWEGPADRGACCPATSYTAVPDR